MKSSYATPRNSGRARVSTILRADHQPEVILAGRRTNNRMGEFVAEKLVKMLLQADLQVKGARVAILGMTFKENVSDLRNSRVPDIVRGLVSFGIHPLVHDPLVEPAAALAEHGITLSDPEALTDLDGLILAVPHGQMLAGGPSALLGMVRPGGVFIDVKSVIPMGAIPADVNSWSL